VTDCDLPGIRCNTWPRPRDRLRRSPSACLESHLPGGTPGVLDPGPAARAIVADGGIEQDLEQAGLLLYRCSRVFGRA
jgi:hypothetical protein